MLNVVSFNNSKEAKIQEKNKNKENEKRIRKHLK